MKRLEIDPYYQSNDIGRKHCIRAVNKIGHVHLFRIVYHEHYPKGLRYRVKAGCRDYSIEEACHHWFDVDHHSHKRRVKTLRKLFRYYKVEKRRIPKQYRKALGYVREGYLYHEQPRR